MRRRLLGLGAVLALLFVVFSLLRGAVPALPTSGALGQARPAAAASAPDATPIDPLPPPPARDIFRYAEPPQPSPGLVRERPSPVVPALSEAVGPPPMAVRLVGLVHRPGGLRAAVSTSEGVVIVGPGDVVEGHTVLGIDEDRGLRLRGPDGIEVSLVPGG